MKPSSRPHNPAIGRRVVALHGGQKGEITAVVRYPSAPWIRYSVTFDDGTTDVGLIVGEHVKMDPGTSS